MVPRRAFLLERAFAKCQSQPGRQHLVIAFKTVRWIRDVHVAEADLPAQPRFQLRGSVNVELRAVIPGVADVGIERKPLTEGRSGGDLPVQLLPYIRLSALPRNGGLRRGSRRGRRCGIRGNQRVVGIIFLVEAAPAKYVESRVRPLHGVISEPSAKYIAQVQVLKRVGFQIGERENEQSPTQVRVSAHPAANIMSRGAADPVDGAL